MKYSVHIDPSVTEIILKSLLLDGYRPIDNYPYNGHEVYVFSTSTTDDFYIRLHNAKALGHIISYEVE